MSVPSAQIASGKTDTVLRQILPRVPPGQPGHSPPPLKAAAPPRKKNTLAACEACKRRKCKCDGQRPACLRCLSTQQGCVYLTGPSESAATNLRRKHSELHAEVQQLREANAALGALFEALRTREACEAEAILQRIREGTDVESIIQSMRAGDLLLHLQVFPEPRNGVKTRL